MARISRQRKFEQVVKRFIVGSPDAMYDIGVGPKSEWKTLSSCFPSMRVFGCEPHPRTRATILERGFPGPLWPVAVGEESSQAILHEPSNNIGGSSLWRLPDAICTYQVDMWSLDRFDTAAGQPDRILLWLDIEGSELAALRSGPKVMTSGRVRWINLEERRHGDLPAEGWTRPAELDACLRDLGYVRVHAYNHHSTHQDAIYVHNSEATLCQKCDLG